MSCNASSVKIDNGTRSPVRFENKIFTYFEKTPGLPDGFFSYQNPNLGIFLRILEWKMLLYILV
jgi:hypothetical protein